MFTNLRLFSHRFAAGMTALCLCASFGAQAQNIDREAWVTRHNPHLSEVDLNGPLSVGNGGFAFTAGVTGMQSFPDAYQEGIPTETMSDWGWNSTPNPEGFTLEDASRPYDTHGKTILYPTHSGCPAGQWLRANPHRYPLGQLGLDMKHADGSPVTPDQIEAIDQTLDMWSGVITSRFAIDGVEVKVETACDPMRDALAFRIQSDLLKSGAIRPFARFPYDHSLDEATGKLKAPMVFDKPGAHETVTTAEDEDFITLHRTLDSAEYNVRLSWDGAATVSNPEKHRYELNAGGDSLVLAVEFSDATLPSPALEAGDVFGASAAHWPAFWNEGGVIDFSHVEDPRAAELERRAVLSNYLLAIQMAGPVPDQESGLTCNSWHGKHHTEMYWWHTAEFALWGHPELLEETMQWYVETLPVARELADYRGLSGARWSKMTGIDGRESPGGNPFIIWNQPHTIALAELLYRGKPTRKTLERWSELVFETAECMSTFAHWEEDNQRYVLGPPCWIAQEIYDQQKSQNPGFELEYWVYGLTVAQQWRERLGMKPNAQWQHVIDHMSPLPVKDGLYVAMESIPDSFDPEVPSSREDHPQMVAPLGLLPGWRVDRPTMERTLDAVMEMWGFDRKIWGWDFPMVAMTAARLDRPELAVNVLLMENTSNVWRVNGHVDQMNDLPIYLPANGSYLSALAMMAAGWDGCETKNPGFPKDWDVRWEGIHPMP